MRILLCTDRMGLGGAETHIALLARGLKQRGHAVTLLSCGGETAEALSVQGIRCQPLPPLARHPASLLRAERRLCEVLRRERPEVVHAHARLPALLLRAPAAGGRFLPVVTVHARFSASPLLSRICYWGERTIAVSEDLRADVCDKFGVPAEQVTVIPNGIDQRLFAPPKDPPPPQALLFASRMDRDCALGAKLLCRLFGRLREVFPQLRLTLVGGGSALSEVRALASALRLPLLPPQALFDSSRAGVCLAGAVPSAQMPLLYRTHRVFVGVSRAAMEAAACGCAVILCGNEGYAGPLTPADPLPLLSNLCCRASPPATLSQLCADLLRVLSNPIPFAVSVPTADEMVEQTLAVYRS